MKEKTKGAQIYLFKSLYTHFCRLQFTRSTDKPFAIIGLEQRLTQQFEDTSGAGVFGKHKGRCLLWRRGDEVDHLDRIIFEDKHPGTHKPPSWSFMAHMGEIEYIDVPGHTVSWERLDLRLTGNAQNSWLYAREPLFFRAEARDFEEKTADDSEHSLLVYDRPSEDRHNDKCIIIGTVIDGLRYVLVVRPKGTNEVGRPQKVLYERAGAGYIPISWIKGGGTDFEIV